MTEETTKTAPKSSPAKAPASPVAVAPKAKAPAPAAAKPAPAAPIEAPTTITPPTAAPIAAISEGSHAMNETVKTVQDLGSDAGRKVQALFGDASDRAKGAYEKGVKLTEDFTEFQKGNVEAMVESGKLAAKAVETLGQEAADYARKSFENGTSAFKTFTSAKSPTELFKLQSDYMKSAFESAVAESTKVTEAWLKLAGDVAQPISNRMAVAVEKVKATASI